MPKVSGLQLTTTVCASALLMRLHTRRCMRNRPLAALLVITSCMSGCTTSSRVGENQVTSKLSCLTDYASIPHGDLEKDYALRGLPVRGIKTNAPKNWQTQCPVSLLSSKTASGTCKKSSVLYSGNSDMPNNPGVQENVMLITEVRGKNHAQIIDPNKKVVVEADLDNKDPRFARGTFADANNVSRTLFVYFLDVGTAQNDLTKVYVAEDFDDTDTSCDSERPDRSGVMPPCGESGQPACPVIVFSREDGVGVGNEHKP